MLVEQILLLLTLLPVYFGKKTVATQDFFKSCEKKINLKHSIAMNFHQFIILGQWVYLRSFPTERLRLPNFPLMFCVARYERLHRN